MGEHEGLLDEKFGCPSGAFILGRDLAKTCETQTREALLGTSNPERKAECELPLVVGSAAGNPQIVRALECWQVIRQELASG